MKKILLIISIISLLFLVGCNSNENIISNENINNNAIADNDNKVLSDFLNKIVLYIKESKANDNIDCEANNISTLYENKYDTLRNIRYAYMDINEDDKMELVTSISYSSLDYDITDIYGVENNNINHIVSSNDKHTYYIVNKNESNKKYIQEEIKIENGLETIYYELIGVQLVEVESIKELYTDSKFYYRAKEGEYVEVSFDKYNEVTDRYPLYSSLITIFEEIDV